MTVLVTPTSDVPLNAVTAAAVQVAGAGRVRLDTGGERIGVRVPYEHASTVCARAGVPDACATREEVTSSSPSLAAAPSGRAGEGSSGRARKKTQAKQRSARGTSNEGE